MSCGCLKTSRQSHFPLTNSSGCDGILRPPSVMRLCKAGASSEVLVCFMAASFRPMPLRVHSGGLRTESSISLVALAHRIAARASLASRRSDRRRASFAPCKCKAHGPLGRTPRSWRAVASFMPEAVPHAAARTDTSIFSNLIPRREHEGVECSQVSTVYLHSSMIMYKYKTQSQ